MAALLIYPDPPPPGILDAVAGLGHEPCAVASPAIEVRDRPAEGWVCAVLVATGPLDGPAAMAEHLRTEAPDTPVVVVAPDEVVETLAGCDFDDFCLSPLRPGELATRIALATRTPVGTDDTDGLITYGPLMINPVTYQAMIDGAPLDLTYMEYELLKYFAERPGRVCTREVLLSQVWGYEYYGGARTVDVHVRRLRAKLGEVHAGLIATVRSVGYRFGTSHWG